MGDSLNQRQADILKEIQEPPKEEAKVVDDKQEWAIVEGGEKIDQIPATIKKDKNKKKKRVEKAEAKTSTSTAKPSPVPTDLNDDKLGASPILDLLSKESKQKTEKKSKKVKAEVPTSKPEPEQAVIAIPETKKEVK